MLLPYILSLIAIYYGFVGVSKLIGILLLSLLSLPSSEGLSIIEAAFVQLILTSIVSITILLTQHIW